MRESEVSSVHVGSVDGLSEVDYLREENQRLRQRVTDLEITVVEYRRQMTSVLRSVSWRVTSPLRVLLARYRTGILRTKRALKRWRERSAGTSGLRLAGLFPPTPGDLPVGSRLARNVSSGRALGRAYPLEIAPLHAGSPRILVVAHVHYPELWGDIDERLSRIHEPFDLLVTVTQGSAESIIPTIARRHRSAQIEIVPNRGRDWAPLIHAVNNGLIGNYTAVAKVHTKKSEHRLDGDSWRLELLDGIFEAPEAIRRTVDLLSLDSSVGLVLPTGHVTGTEHWGSNLGTIEALASRMSMAFDPDALRFPAGSMFWCRPWLLQRLADLNLDLDNFEPEGGQYDGTTAHALERFVGVMLDVGGMEIVEAMDVSSHLRAIEKSPVTAPRLLGFYLPQYHQSASNDEFWGEGFTDWENVESAAPLFHGHQQPLSPPDSVGLYDLSDPLELARQAVQVNESGLDGLIFYHYWFNGRTELRTPLENLLISPKIALPFALCWANEPWTRSWDGLESDILIPADLTEGWEARFYADIRSALFDPRYITVDGKPLLMVYRLDLIPDLPSTVAAWRHLAQSDGLSGLHVVGVIPSRDFGSVSGNELSALDGLVAFPPGSAVNLQSIKEFLPHGSAGLGGDVYSYDSAARFVAPEIPEGFVGPIHPTVFPGWDNTARRGNDAYVFHGANQLAFRRWLASAAQYAAANTPSLVFVNAWNEWAEGAAVEGSVLPDQFGPRP